VLTYHSRVSGTGKTNLNFVSTAKLLLISTAKGLIAMQILPIYLFVFIVRGKKY